VSDTEDVDRPASMTSITGGKSEKIINIEIFQEMCMETTN